MKSSSRMRPNSKFENYKYDHALEDLLKAGHYKEINTNWTDRNLFYMSETKTFMEAIDNKPRKKMNPAISEDPTRSKENHIRHIIMRPLSPRKPIVIPRSTSTSVHRDKQGLEKIIKQRSQRQTTQQLPSYNITKDNQNIARHSTIPRIQLSSYGSRKPTYYWGT